MKIHWGQCNEETYWKQIIFEKGVSTGLLNELKSVKEVNNTLTQKISHLEQVISDYQKASLIQQAPVYIEMTPSEEQTRQKRTRRA
jgi:hypothetical protein